MEWESLHTIPKGVELYYSWINHSDHHNEVMILLSVCVCVHVHVLVRQDLANHALNIFLFFRFFNKLTDLSVHPKYSSFKKKSKWSSIAHIQAMPFLWCTQLVNGFFWKARVRTKGRRNFRHIVERDEICEVWPAVILFRLSHRGKHL